MKKQILELGNKAKTLNKMRIACEKELKDLRHAIGDLGREFMELLTENDEATKKVLEGTEWVFDDVDEEEHSFKFSAVAYFDLPPTRVSLYDRRGKEAGIFVLALGQMSSLQVRNETALREIVRRYGIRIKEGNESGMENVGYAKKELGNDILKIVETIKELTKEGER